MSQINVIAHRDACCGSHGFKENIITDPSAVFRRPSHIPLFRDASRAQDAQNATVLFGPSTLQALRPFLLPPTLLFLDTERRDGTRNARRNRCMAFLADRT